MERIADPAGAASAIQSLKGYLDELIRARRRQPEDDIVKETTIIAMGASMLYLARNPGLKARLRENAELLELAVEEFLRIEPPAQAHARTLSADVEVHGRRSAPASGCSYSGPPPIGTRISSPTRIDSFPIATPTAT